MTVNFEFFRSVYFQSFQINRLALKDFGDGISNAILGEKYTVENIRSLKDRFSLLTVKQFSSRMKKLKILTVQSGTCAVSFALMGPSPSACPSPGRGTLGPGSV